MCTFAVSWIWCTGQMTYATYCEVASSFLSLKRTTSATSQLTTSQCKYGRRFKKETDICTEICAKDLRLLRCTASSPCVYVKRFEKKYGKKRHPQTAQTGGTYDKDLKITIPGTPSKMSAKIAPKLAEHLVHRSLAYMKERGHDRFPQTRRRV